MSGGNRGSPGALESTDANLEFYYKHQNNVATYDPSSNEFFRIPHPVPVADPDNPGNFVPTDLFCSGHVHLPDGNPYFNGGTQFYLPFFTGTRSTWVFDWVADATGFDWPSYDWTNMPKNQRNSYDTDAAKAGSDTPWSFAGLMEVGRWYPSIIPLMDGRVVVVGGFRDLRNSSNSYEEGEMYPFEVNSAIDFFDYRKFDAADPSAALVHRNVADMANSPFQTRLPEDDWTDHALCNPIWPNRQCESYRNDTFKLYPRAVLMPDNQRIFFTRDGDFNSMRDKAALAMRNTKFSYMMDVGTDPDEPVITFERGPNLPRYALNGGNVVRDPTDPSRLLVSGGMANSGGFYAPGFIEADDPRCDITSTKTYDVRLCNHYLGGRGTRAVLAYRMPADRDGVGSWEPEDNSFLGPDSNSERTMHYKVILPTRQLLVVGGGNYWFGMGVRHPVLFTPNEDGGGYDAGRLVAPQLSERNYHTTALLLADGRVFMAGSNPNRALLDENQPLWSERNPDTQGEGQKKFNPDGVTRDLYFLHDGMLSEGHKAATAEDWTAEIYSPPYLFIDGNRRSAIKNLILLEPPSDENGSLDNFTFFEDVGDKRHYLLRSNLSVKVELEGLPDPGMCKIEEGSLSLIKLGSATHGWDSGQQYFEMPISTARDDGESTSGFTGSLEFTAPSSMEKQILPGFYHLFYVDCRGKPTVAQSVRFDDNVLSIKDRAKAQ